MSEGFWANAELLANAIAIRAAHVLVK